MKNSFTESKIDTTKITTVDNSQSFDTIVPSSDYKKYTPLSRQDFDMKVTENWCELRTKMQPKRRAYHSSFIYKEFFYVYGGVDIMSGKLNDFCRINLTGMIPKWEHIIPQGEPTERIAYHKGCESEGKYYIIGGQNQNMNSSNTVYIYHIDKNVLEKLNFNVEDFPPIESHSANILHSQKQIIIYGGYSMGALTSNVYSFNIQNKTFAKLNGDTSSPAPQGRFNHSAALYANNLYIYSGEGKGGEYLNDMWVFNLANKIWTEIKVPFTDIPAGRSGHNMVVNKDMFYIFGGKTGNLRETNEFWRFDPLTNEFSLIHDSLLEQFTNQELHDMKPKDEDNGKNQKVFRWITKKDIPALNPLFRVKDKMKKKKFDNALSRSQVMLEYKKKWEADLVRLTDVSSIQKSTIYNLEDNMEKINNKLTGSVKNLRNPLLDLTILGNVPFPRDGQSAEVYCNLIIIFGGDRNKFPYNDLYTFIMP